MNETTEIMNGVTEPMSETTETSGGATDAMTGANAPMSGVIETMSETMVLSRELAKAISRGVAICCKEIWTLDELSEYTGFSKSHVYKLMMNRQIPHYKPCGKMCFFKRHEIENWLQMNPVATNEEISLKARQIGDKLPSISHEMAMFRMKRLEEKRKRDEEKKKRLLARI